MIALDFTEKRVVLARHFVAINNSIGTFAGPSCMLKNRQVVKRLRRDRQALLFITGSFTASATDATGQVHKDTHSIRIAAKTSRGCGIFASAKKCGGCSTHNASFQKFSSV
jgi:hypothetical protein